MEITLVVIQVITSRLSYILKNNQLQTPKNNVLPLFLHLQLCYVNHLTS